MRISKFFDHIADVNAALNEQRAVYKQLLALEDSCPANSQKTSKISISNYGHFLIQRIYGTYTTLELSGQNPVDTGINYLKGKIQDASVNRPLFDSFIPFNLLFTPGRQKVLVDNTAFPNLLFYPLEFTYLMTINSDFQIDVQNSSTYKNDYVIVLEGFRIEKDYKEKRV